MSRILIVSELFYPDDTSTAHILTKIADYLHGTHEVLILAGPKSYSSDKVIDSSDTTKPYMIKRIKVGRYDKNKLISRALRLFITSIKLGKLLWTSSRKTDQVLIVTNPAPFLIVASIIKEIKGFKLNILVHDVFPENTIAARVIKSEKSIPYKILKSVFSKAYRSADRVIVLGRDMKENFSRKFEGYKTTPKIEIIENWADPTPAEIKCTTSDHGNIIILYAGNIGRCQGLGNFIDLFDKASNNDIELVMRGGGAMASEIERILDKSGANIVLGGSYTRNEQFEILSNCDIALVTLAEGMYGLGVPSKSYNIMAAGKPILFIGDLKSEIAMVVREYGIGYCFAPSDKKGIINWLKSISLSSRNEFRQKGLKAKQLADTIYSEDTILEKYSNLFLNT